MAVEKVSDATFENEVLKASGPVVVDFWAEWCGPCRMIAPALDEISSALGDKVKEVRVTFRLTSVDVIHGFQIVGTNANTMVVPGYVSEFTTVFDRPGEYLIVCNEYCGLSHHVMHATLIVTPRAR